MVELLDSEGAQDLQDCEFSPTKDFKGSRGLLMALPAVRVGAVLLVLQGVQVGLCAVAVVQQAGVQLQNGCVCLVRVCV